MFFILHIVSQNIRICLWIFRRILSISFQLAMTFLVKSIECKYCSGENVSQRREDTCH